MPRRRRQPKPDEPTGDESQVPCMVCALAVPAPPKPPPDSILVAPWPTCDTCTRLIKTGGVPAILYDLIHRDLDATETVVSDFVTSAQMPAARKLDRFTSLPNPLETVTDSYRGPVGPYPRPGTGLPERWGWLTPADVEQVAAALDQALHYASTPRRHRAGPCGSCGARRTTAWAHLKPVQLDLPRRGDRWPLCQPCGEAFLRSGASAHNPSWRSHLTALALGMPKPLMGVSMIQPYAETVESRDNAPGCAAPWSFIPVERLALARRTVWHRLPHLAPPEWRARQERIRVASAMVAPPTRRPDGVVLFTQEEQRGLQPGIDW